MLSILLIVGAVGLVTLLIGAVGWLFFAPRLESACDKTLLTAVSSVIMAFVYTWLLYILNLPWALLWLLPAAGLAALLGQWRAAVDLGRDPLWRQVIILQASVTAWCLAWNAMVANYSGGGWASDWYEHWERAQFFLGRWPRDTMFIASYPLTARPPLTNILVAALLFLTRPDFAHYQVAMTLLSSAVFFPAALLAYRWRPEKYTVAVVAALFMASPFFLQNATFPWTKLPAAFLILASVYLSLLATTPSARALYCAGAGLAMTAALLSHYSAGPYGLVLGVAWLVRMARVRWAGRSVQPELRAGAYSILLAALWFGWSFAAYGTKSTLASNSSIRGSAESFSAQATRVALNIRDTLVPYFARRLDEGLIAQSSAWGSVRDQWFQFYQLNLYGAFGVAGGAAMLWVLFRLGRSTPRSSAYPVLVAILAIVFLGIAVHGPRDTWGLTQICLQPLVLLGLALLASQISGLPRIWRWALFLGGTFDLVFGIVLQFLVENFAVNRWYSNGVSPNIWLLSYNNSATINLFAKVQHRLVFLNDFSPHSLGGSVAVLILAAAGVIYYLAPRRSDNLRDLAGEITAPPFVGSDIDHTRE